MNRILIVEDEDRIASFVRKGLAANGFATTVVGDGRGAVDYALSGDFDLMVLDLGLPDMDGSLFCGPFGRRGSPPRSSFSPPGTPFGILSPDSRVGPTTM